jgi:HAD superfamily hydrolase (TIGR01509 family)
VVFDAAGTLFTHRDLAGHLSAIATRAGYPVPRAQLASVLEQLETMPVWPEDSRDHAERLQRWQRFFRRAFTLAGVSDATANDGCAATAAEYVADAASYEVLPDVTATLTALSGHGHHMAVGSNFDYLLSGILDRLGLAGYFEAVIKSVDLGVYKPDQEFYAALLRIVGAPASQVLFVGDSPRSDVLGPQAAGMAALLVDRMGRHSGLGLPSVAALTDLISPAGSDPC